MTGSADQARHGLSFTDEVQWLTALRLGVEPGGLGRATARSLPEAVDRTLLAANLQRDLWESPAPIARHPEWDALAREALPVAVRDAPLQANWLQPPCVSGRHLRAGPREPGRLALLPDAARQPIVARATRRALLLLLRSLGRRERLSCLAVLGETQAASLRRRIEQKDGTDTTLRLPLLQGLRRGFVRASGAASSPAHLLSRFGSFVLAVALGPRHRVEARALAEGMPLRTGRRLLRYHGQAGRRWAALSDEVMGLLVAGWRQVEGADTE